ncbi:hypothetical protein HAZT_HAZT008941 [Hyalella azteca]|uniref:Alpha N-terminal protein methyltransferase 1 n=1 Tax=Hyalella azteca TaxID=294128 RepID=A0A6A0GXP8_HYAAZ|nr:N-terminal Xaa-Pro-Lys N-methyltransferase 1 [Hyalella azteca]KAA0192255.1 hypothetical protein HAZT_HAZT008941 [Hyalella azteca]
MTSLLLNACTEAASMTTAASATPMDLDQELLAQGEKKSCFSVSAAAENNVAVAQTCLTETQRTVPTTQLHKETTLDISIRNNKLNAEESSAESRGAGADQKVSTVVSNPDFNDKIDYSLATSYWKTIPATVNGMLGGFARISTTDINGSNTLLKWIFSQEVHPGRGRCVDCGAGIGRITQRLLQRNFGKVDLVEQSPEFVAKAKEVFANNSKIGEIHCIGLQDFVPKSATYDVVWMQWVLGYLRDDDLVAFFRRMSNSLKPNGVIVVKENFSSDADDSSAEVIHDEADSSVTRPMALFLQLTSKAGLTLVRLVQQKKFPRQLFKVYMLVLKPEKKDNSRTP